MPSTDQKLAVVISVTKRASATSTYTSESAFVGTGEGRQVDQYDVVAAPQHPPRERVSLASLADRPGSC